MVGLTTALGLVGFLSEPDPKLRVYALKRLDEDVDLLWTEVAGSVGQMLVLPIALTGTVRVLASDLGRDVQ